MLHGNSSYTSASQALTTRRNYMHSRKSKKNYGFCSSECREARKAAKKAPPTQCEHGRQKSRCKDCGTGYCKHGRQKCKCKDCG
jgi:hypothetical protein